MDHGTDETVRLLWLSELDDVIILQHELGETDDGCGAVVALWWSEVRDRLRAAAGGLPVASWGFSREVPIAWDVLTAGAHWVSDEIEAAHGVRCEDCEALWFAASRALPLVFDPHSTMFDAAPDDGDWRDDR